MEALSVPLFPLNTVLFPGGPLPLRIFEPRYLDMVARCVKNDSCFGVCLIEDGKEARDAAVPHSIGTLARIIDWDKLPDGMLGIVALGSDRFHIDSTDVESNQLIHGTVTLLPNLRPASCRLSSRSCPAFLRRSFPRRGHCTRPWNPTTTTATGSVTASPRSCRWTCRSGSTSWSRRIHWQG